MKKKNYLVAGVDEAGRGPLAGPVFAAAVILDFKKPIAGLKDSKLLSEKSREYLFNIINEKCLAVAVGSADVLEIDKLNILHASMLAMQRALLALTINPEKVLVDGNRCPDVPFPSEAIVKGDQKIAAISAASIIAKVTRDRLMRELHQHYPNYGFVHNKGYPTEFHLRCLQKFGPCEIHRSTFEPVRMAASIHHTLLSSQER